MANRYGRDIGRRDREGSGREGRGGDTGFDRTRSYGSTPWGDDEPYFGGGRQSYGSGYSSGPVRDDETYDRGYGSGDFGAMEYPDRVSGSYGGDHEGGGRSTRATSGANNMEAVRAAVIPADAAGTRARAAAADIRAAGIPAAEVLRADIPTAAGTAEAEAGTRTVIRAAADRAAMAITARIILLRNADTKAITTRAAMTGAGGTGRRTRLLLGSGTRTRHAGGGRTCVPAAGIEAAARAATRVPTTALRKTSTTA